MRSKVKHGMSGSPTHNSWRSMRDRCLRPTTHNYNNYGGNGVQIYPLWEEDFLQFLKDMGERPTGTTLDRKDSKGDYTPDNCRWATDRQQAENRKSTSSISWMGVTQSYTRWAETLEIPLSRIWGRVEREWDIDRILSTPKLTKGGKLWIYKQ